MEERHTMKSRDPREGPPAPDRAPEQSPPGVEAALRPRADHGEQTYRGAHKLEGLAALVTGGDRGIGRAVAIAFAREGADVAIGYYDESERVDAEETASWVRRAGRQCVIHPFDVNNPEACKRFVERAYGELGRLDILVNDAAHQQERRSVLEITPDQLEDAFRTNVFASFFMVQAALPRMEPGGSIIHCGSVVAMEGHPTLLDYSATKGAIHTFTRSLALNLAERGIRVNCVAPGPVWTPLIPATLEARSLHPSGGGTHWGRPAQPAEIAPSFVFFASNDSRYYTGEVLAATGRGATR